MLDGDVGPPDLLPTAVVDEDVVHRREEVGAQIAHRSPASHLGEDTAQTLLHEVVRLAAVPNQDERITPKGHDMRRHLMRQVVGLAMVPKSAHVQRHPLLINTQVHVFGPMPASYFRERASDHPSDTPPFRRRCAASGE
jgi:hypothetical protein